MMENQNDTHTTTVRDVEQLGILAALGSLSYVFWVGGGMEMVERLAMVRAREAKRGLWRGEFMPPWEWRGMMRDAEK